MMVFIAAAVTGFSTAVILFLIHLIYSPFKLCLTGFGTPHDRFSCCFKDIMFLVFGSANNVP